VILLDTHVLVWWVEGSRRLSTRVAKTIADRGTVLVSPISFWELAVMVGRGRVSVDRDLVCWAGDLLTEDGVDIAELTPPAAISAAHLAEFHGDPADRFIYATARELGVPLASKDRRIRGYARRHRDVQVVW
jgi:PIN domain nuclease of toxin-antitoxin system